MPLQLVTAANPAANYVTVARSSLIEPAIVTVMCWVNLVTSPGGSIAYICSSGDAFSLVYNGSACYFYIYDGGYYNINDATALTVGTWTHIVGRYNSGGSFDMYRDGALSASGSHTGALSYLTRPFTIGCGGVGTEGLNILAHIADVRIYNRIVGIDEIQCIYACKGVDGITNGLLARWMLDEGYEGQDVGSSSGIVKDCSDNKLDGDTVNVSGSGPSYSSGMFSVRRQVFHG